MTRDPDARASFCLLCGGRLEPRVVFGLERKACRECDFVFFRPTPTAAVAIVASGRDVLLVRRGIEPYRGCWGFPGGFQDYGETLAETARRETREEAGLDIDLVRVFAVEYTRDDPRKRSNVVVYLARPRPRPGVELAARLRPADDAVAAQFFPIDTLPDAIAFENNVQILQRLLAEFPSGAIR